jgi:predicted branched-subunit amino acid permease
MATSERPSAKLRIAPALDRSNNVRQASAASDFRAGFVGTMPLWLGAAPFGAIYAVSALAAGLDWAQTLAMSLFVFAGASQFTAAGLFASAAAPLTIVITTLVINARHALLAAAAWPTSSAPTSACT